MVKRSLAIAMAFVGLVVGAGFASGQEIMQYFGAFGLWGIVGAAAASVLMVVSGIAVLQMGSFLQAREHTAVFTWMTNRVLATILDWSVIVTLFATGFVMFAGGGSNLNQQFGLPIWIGAVIMLVLVLGAGMLDVDKVSDIISLITPFAIVLLAVGSIYALVTMPADLTPLTEAARSVETPMPNWPVGALNYVGLCLMVGVSMALVIGGDNLNPREAGIGGAIGGVIYCIMLTLCAAGLFMKVDVVGNDDMPMLTLMSDLHPWFGVAMAVAAYGMIFNTAIGMFYALARRLTKGHPEKFRVVFVVSILVGFAISFLGFKLLVSTVYPVLGYLGILLIATVSVAWFRHRRQIAKESTRREDARELQIRKMDPEQDFSTTDEDRLQRLTRKSNVDDDQLRAALESEAVDEIDGVDESDLPDHGEDADAATDAGTAGGR